MPPHARRENGGQRSVECICGGTFSRPDVLERHIASMNKVVKVSCPFCEHKDPPKTFSRLDHLPQHLKTYHKIPAGKIPTDFAANLASDDTAGESAPPIPPPLPPQPTPFFPCLVPGCVKTGESAYLRQVDLDEHMHWAHGSRQDYMLIPQGLSDSVRTWANNGVQQNQYSQHVSMFGQDVQQNVFSQPVSAGNFQADGGFMGSDAIIGDLSFPPYQRFDTNFEMDFNFDG
ncbi:hypothetical protein GGS24DRAFT_239021 [Hypoxylon argillaceum]|nr:hypothetical protein GGS24DRAFT_239021 [Hypoxylon argillaceum]